MYDAREKRLRDQRWLINSSVRQGREEGLEEGLDLGKLLGEIKSYQRLLGLTQSSDQELLEQDPTKLAAMASELENQILKNLRR